MAHLTTLDTKPVIGLTASATSTGGVTAHTDVITWDVPKLKAYGYITGSSGEARADAQVSPDGINFTSASGAAVSTGFFAVDPSLPFVALRFEVFSADGTSTVSSSMTFCVV
jgi:hypothetical protein